MGNISIPELMPASEAKAIVENNEAEKDAINLAQTINSINNAIQKGEFGVSVGLLRKPTIEFIKNKGYVVSNNTDPRDNGGWEISWK